MFKVHDANRPVLPAPDPTSPGALDVSIPAAPPDVSAAEDFETASAFMFCSLAQEIA
jgi:hypothetical protein